MNVFAIIREEPLEIDGETVDLRILFQKMRSRKQMTIPAGRALGWISLRTGHSGTMQR